MKSLLKLVCIGLLFTTSSVFADTYEGSMTGIACSGCKKKIIKALAQFEGIVEVRIAAKEDQEDAHKLTVITEGDIELTEEQVRKAVAVADHYKMTSWQKVKPENESEANPAES